MAETVYYNGLRVEIKQDSNPESPREWDNIGNMVCWNNRYNLGDKHTFHNPEHFQEWLRENPAIVLPLFLYDHSGLSMSCNGNQYPYNDIWDSGQVGYIYVTLSDIREEYKVKRVSRKLRKRIVSYLTSDVTTYDSYLRGDVYGYEAHCQNCGEFVDSCWGFYGNDPKTNGIFDNLTGFVCDNCLELQSTVRG